MRLGPAHATGDMLLDLVLEVRAQLAIELGIDSVAMDERAKAQPENLEQSVHDQALRSVSWMAADSRSH
jgi:hypothetical protein